MALFGGSTKKGFIGIDIGAGSVKITELVTEKNRPRLMTYGYTESGGSKADKPLIEDQKKATDLVTKVYKKAGVGSTKVVAALPLSKVFSAVIRVPRVKDEKDLKPLIEAQARKLLPLPLEEMILDSKLVDEIKKPSPAKKVPKGQKPTQANAPKKPLIGERKEQEYMRVLITGAAKSLVQKYVQIFKAAKLELVALETESFALIRSLIGKDKSSTLIIDIGATRTNLTVVEKGIPFLTRSVNVGGDMVTKQIADQMGVEFAEAEQIKYDLAGEAGNSIPAIEQVLQPVLNEIQYSFEQYAKQETTDGKKVEKIIITGGSAHLPGLTNLISTSANINTYIGDPWARVVYPEDLRPILDEIGPRMSVAVGLAMRENS